MELGRHFAKRRFRLRMLRMNVRVVETAHSSTIYLPSQPYGRMAMLYQLVWRLLLVMYDMLFPGVLCVSWWRAWINS